MATTKEISNFAEKDGEYRRQTSDFRQILTSDQVNSNPNRFHLYVSYACPWAHRTLIVRALKGLDHLISVDVVHYLMRNRGWELTKEEFGATGDRVNGKQLLREVYEMADPNYNKRWTVPVLWDKSVKTIVNNESSEIIRIFNSAFNDQAKNPSLDLYPEALRSEIDEVNTWVYDNINNGVYKTGFATAQDVYEKHCRNVFAHLDKVEKRLSTPLPDGSLPKYLVGNVLTEADIRLFTTILRFDPVYITHFKCNLGTIASNYPTILTWLRRIYQLPGVKDTCNMEHIKRHYFMSHTSINPNQIVGLNCGPDLETPRVEP